MILEILIILITLLAASYYDLIKKTVPGHILYPILITGAISTLIVMATHADPLMRYVNLILACSFLAVGIVAHFKNLLGGADILLIIGIILMTPIEFMTPEFYMFFFFFTCLAGIAYYLIVRFSSKEKIDTTIKFVPAILIGYSVTTFGLFFNEILAALVGLL